MANVSILFAPLSKVALVKDGEHLWAVTIDKPGEPYKELAPQMWNFGLDKSTYQAERDDVFPFQKIWDELNAEYMFTTMFMIFLPSMLDSELEIDVRKESARLISNYIKNPIALKMVTDCLAQMTLPKELDLNADVLAVLDAPLREILLAMPVAE